MGARKKGTRDARGEGAWLPLALPFFLSPKYFQAPATQASHVLSPHVTVVPSISWICFFGPELNSSNTLVKSQLIGSCQLIAWSCVLLELFVSVISSVSQPLCYQNTARYEYKGYPGSFSLRI